MSWLWSKQKEPGLPPPTALHTQRNRQIEALRNCNQNVIELQRDVEYRVSITAFGTTLNLHINLPPSFPQEPPVVKVHPQVTHPWVNEHMLVTGCQSLNSFSIHSDLGRVIRQIVDEFQLNPPSLKPGYSQAAYPYIPPSSLPTCPPPYPPPQTTALYSPDTPTLTPTGHAQTPLEEKLRSVPAPTPYTLPDMPSTFPELEKMSVTELEKLVNDEEKIQRLVALRNEMSTISDDLKQMRANNDNIARENLSLQPLLEEKKQNLLEAFDVMTSLRQNFDSRSYECEELRSQYQPVNLLARLQISTAQAEQTSESIAEMFIDGKLDVDEFKKQFIESRKLWYSRKAKEERYVDGGWR